MSQVLRTLDFGNGSALRLCRGSVLEHCADVLVNAANEEGLGGRGIDGAFNELGGVELKRAREALPFLRRDVRIETGSAVVTSAGGNLPCKFVIHAVGPNYSSLDEDFSGSAEEKQSKIQKAHELLASAYDAIVDLSISHQAKTIGCCLLSAGEYRGHRSLSELLSVAVGTLVKSLTNLPRSTPLDVALIAFTEAEAAALCQVFDDNYQAVAFFKRLLRVRTVSGEGPKGAYREMAALLVQECQLLGCDDVVCEEFVPGKPVVVATLRGTDPALKSILFTSHYDVVPAEASKWTIDPWSAVEVNGRIYGRGTQDMKCVIAQQLSALRRLKVRGVVFKRTLHFSFLPDEEIGGVDGMLAFIKSSLFSSLQPVALALDEGLANEKDAFTVFYGERSPFWILITSTGPTGHGSRFIRETAVEKLLRFTGRAFEFRRQQELDFLGKAEGHEGCAHSNAKKLGEVTTLNVTFLKAGVAMQQDQVVLMDGEEKMSLNVVPTVAKAGIDMRVPPSVPIKEITSMLDEWVLQVGEGVSWRYAPWTHPSEEHHVSPIDVKADPFWAAFHASLEGFGVTLELEVFPAGTDSRYLRALGIPCYGFSPLRNSPILLHEHDEYLGVDVFKQGVDVYAKIMMDLCVKFGG